MKTIRLIQIIAGPMLLCAGPALAGGGIPDRFHGHWALAAADCQAGEPTALLLIDQTGVHQAEGEMIAVSVTVDAADPDHIVVQAQNSGGGGDWTSVEEFTLTAAGKSLHWQTLGADAPPPGQLFRCD